MAMDGSFSSCSICSHWQLCIYTPICNSLLYLIWLIHLILCAGYTLFCQSSTTCNLGMKKTCHFRAKMSPRSLRWSRNKTVGLPTSSSRVEQSLDRCPLFQLAGFRVGLLLTSGKSEMESRTEAKAMRVEKPCSLVINRENQLFHHGWVVCTYKLKLKIIPGALLCILKKNKNNGI